MRTPFHNYMHYNTQIYCYFPSTYNSYIQQYSSFYILNSAEQEWHITVSMVPTQEAIPTLLQVLCSTGNKAIVNVSECLFYTYIIKSDLSHITFLLLRLRLTLCYKATFLYPNANWSEPCYLNCSTSLGHIGARLLRFSHTLCLL